MLSHGTKDSPAPTEFEGLNFCSKLNRNNVNFVDTKIAIGIVTFKTVSFNLFHNVSYIIANWW
jgi:hypothetical protein